MAHMAGDSDPRTRNPCACTPQKAIGWLGATAGLILLFLTPPFQVPDEFAHFYRAYHVSRGHLQAQVKDHRVGDFLPRSLVATATEPGFNAMPFHPENKMRLTYLEQAFALRLDPRDQVFADFPNTALTSPVPYLPQAAGMACLTAFRPPPILLLYAGRLANFAVWLLLMAAAVRAAPIGKWLFVMLALMPMSIFQAASLSPDAFTNGVAFLVTALGLRLGLDSTQAPDGRATIRFAALAMALALCKFAYVFFGLLFFLPALRWMELTHRRRLFRQGLLVIGLAALAWLAWTLAARGLFLKYDQYDPLYRDGLALRNGADPDAQLAIVLTAPLTFVTRATASLVEQRIWEPLIAHLGWLDVIFPRWFIYAFGAGLAATALTGGTRECFLTRPQKIFVAMITGVSILFFCLLSYLQWSPVGWPRVIDLQGRYFIPIAPIALLVLTNRRFALAPGRWRDAIYVGGLSFSLAVTILLVASRYY